MSQKEHDLSFSSLFTPFTTKKALLFLFLIGTVVFFNALGGGFIWDDISFILTHDELHSFNFLTLIGPNVYNSGGYYRAVPALYIAAVYSTFGPQPFYFHLLQVLLHMVNAALLFVFLKRFFPKLTAWILAVIFLIHPTQVESVTLISSVQSNLFFFFGILALIINERVMIPWKRLFLVGFFLFCSLMTKETGVLFLGIVLLYQLLFKKRKEFFTSLTLISIIPIYLLIRFQVGKDPFTKNISNPIGQLSLLERMRSIPEIIFFYIKTLFFPVKLAIDQTWVITTVNFSQFFLPLVIDLLFVSLLLAAGIVVYKKRKSSGKLYLFFLLWFAAGLGMLLQLFPLDMTVAERWMYFPIVGLLGMGGIVAQTFHSHLSRYKTYYTTAIMCVLVLLSLRTIVRNANYENAIVLYSHDIQVEDNYDLENMLGGGLMVLGKYQEALPHLLRSNEMYLHDSTLFNIASTYDQLKNYKKAEEYYRKVISLEKDTTLIREDVRRNSYLALAKLLILHEKKEVAIVFMEKAIRAYPKESAYWAYLAICQYTLGEKDQALVSAEKAKSLLPNSSTTTLYNKIRTNQEIVLR